MKFIQWFAGFFEDQKGSASSKRLVLYVTLWFMYLQIQAGIAGKITDTTMNYYMYWGNVILVAFCVGMVTAEFVGGFLNKISSEKTIEVKKTTEKKEENKPDGQ